MRAMVGVLLAAVALASCTSHAQRAAPPRSAASILMSSAASPSATSTHAIATTPHPSGLRTFAKPRSTAVNPAHPCGVSATTHYTHVMWIWMENKPFGSVIGSGSAPYENALAKDCGLATNYHGITHPSLPNYLAATGGSTFGVHDDSGPASHPINADSIFGELDRAGLRWRSYEESMPSNCDHSAASPYAVKHNPAAYFTAIARACSVDDVPLAGNLDRDLAAGTLPSFAFVTPNLCNDTHDCSVHIGDAWLATWIPKILAASNYRDGNTLVVLTWDEGVGPGNLIPTIVVGPTVRAGTEAAQRFDHYALLRTTEELLGVSLLGAAASASSMAPAFHL